MPPCPDFYRVEFFLMEMEIHSINQMGVTKGVEYKGFESLWLQFTVEGPGLHGRLGPLCLGMLLGGESWILLLLGT